MSEITVASMHVYPIKSCGAMDLQTTYFDQLGMEHDRNWAVVSDDDKHRVFTQRVLPKMALIEPVVSEEGLCISAPDAGEVFLPHDEEITRDPMQIDLFEKIGTGIPLSPTVDEFLSDYLGKHVQLVKIQQPRTIKPDCHVDGASTVTGFADGFPLLLTSQESLNALNQDADKYVAMDRFRPNIVVEGGEAYEEDYWRELRIGTLQAFVVRACARCPMPNIDQETGELPKPAERYVTTALRATRSGIDIIGSKQKVDHFYGQNLTHVVQLDTTVSVGDVVTVVTRSNERNFKPTP